MKTSIALTLAAGMLLAGCAAPTSGSRGGAAAPSSGSSWLSEGATSSTGAMPPVTVAELSGRSVAPLDAPIDLWDRIRRGYAMPDLDNDLVRKHEQWYLGKPDYMQRMVDRSRMYIFHIVEELELRGMPTELALLPYIESAFNPQAVSSAKATGMWQIMPGTGRDYQLNQNIFRDDRRDVLNSTRAALDHLQRLHKMFGDWHLALAAYNWGQGNVQRAIERNRAAGLPTGYMDLNMPPETRNYVPKLQAVKNIVGQPQRYSARLPEIGNHPFFDLVDITQDMDVAVAARLADVRPEDFKALNPSQHKPIIFATGTPQILLPWDNAATFKANLAAADPATLASWTAWVAPSTMPSREAARAVGMAESELLELNNIPRGMLVKQGSTLMVPRRPSAAQAVASHVVNNAQITYTPEIVLKRTTVRARKGDTLASLAARYDLPPAMVAGWNHSQPGAALKRGQPVVVFLPVRAAAQAARDGLRRGHQLDHRAAERPAKAERHGGRRHTASRAAPTPKSRQSAKAAPSERRANAASGKAKKQR